MHELAVTEGLLEICLRHAEEARAKRVTDLYLVIGELSSIVDDSIQFYWEMISLDTLAEGSRLNFKRIPIGMLCLECRQGYSPSDDDFACPFCGSTRLRIVAGEEFFLEAIEIEETGEIANVTSSRSRPEGSRVHT